MKQARKKFFVGEASGPQHMNAVQPDVLVFLPETEVQE